MHRVRHILVAVGAIASVGAAHAEWEGLAFTFAPLQCASTSMFPPGTSDCGLVSLSGMFTYDDVNADGRVVLSELLQLRVGAIVAPGPGFFGVPAEVFSFDYAPDTGLHFSASDGWRHKITTGVSYGYFAPLGSTVYSWLPTTTTSIHPVPEPASLWLLLAGGAGLALRYRLARRAA